MHRLGNLVAIKLHGARAGVYYVISDHLGTPQMVIDAEGQVVWQGDYLPFGEMIVTADEVGNSIRFPGQYFDAETGLHYNWNRYYDPATGRYISADPIGLAGGINLYAYVGGDPVNAVDPWGLYQDGFTHGWEAHFVVGVGQFHIRCCDEEWDEELIHTYRKVCLGAAIDVSYGVAYTSGMGGKSCSNPPKKFLGGELGALVVEGGVSVDVDGSGVGGTGGGTGGVGIGGVKATACFYFYHATEYTGKKCKCEG